MPFHIIQGDITRIKADAIVNAANSSLLGGGGVDGAIHRAAGPRLLEECRMLHGCDTGEAKVTLGYDLPAKYVIHTVGPIWRGGRQGEPELLASAYRNSLLLALEKHCESVAFPLISSGVYGYPLEGALEVAVSTIRAFLEDHEMDVTLVIFDKSSFRFDIRLYSDISGYIRNHCEEPERPGSFLGDAAKSVAFGGVSGSRRSLFSRGKKEALKSSERGNGSAARAYEEVPCKEAVDEDVAEVADEEAAVFESRPMKASMPDAAMEAQAMRCAAAMPVAGMAKSSEKDALIEALKNLDESFSQALLRLIDARGMKDSECYKKANIDRKLFSKIRSDIHYRPSKQTVLAFAVALVLHCRTQVKRT